jgi:hypothetical protein
VGSKARPPVAKIVSYREVERRLQDEEREAARRTREQKKLDKPKEMQFSPRWVGCSVWPGPWLSKTFARALCAGRSAARGG